MTGCAARRSPARFAARSSPPATATIVANTAAACRSARTPPSGPPAVGRLAAPLLPVDLLPPAQQLATISPSRSRPNCTTRSITASSPRGQPVAEFAVDQLDRAACRSGPGRARWKCGIEPGLDRVRPQQRAAERVDRADARRVQLADQFGASDRPAASGHSSSRPVQAARMRSRISRAARSVKVMATSCPSRGRPARLRRSVQASEKTFGKHERLAAAGTAESAIETAQPWIACCCWAVSFRPLAGGDSGDMMT